MRCNIPGLARNMTDTQKVRRVPVIVHIEVSSVFARISLDFVPGVFFMGKYFLRSRCFDQNVTGSFNDGKVLSSLITLNTEYLIHFL